MAEFLFRALHVFIFTYLGLLVILFFVQRSLIYFPDNTHAPVVNGVEVVHVKTQDGLALEAWFIPGAEPVKKTILLFHGNAGNYTHRLGKALEFTQAGYNVLLAEYRGYGGNPGSPSEDGFYKDGRAYFSYLTDKKGMPRKILSFTANLLVREPLRKWHLSIILHPLSFWNHPFPVLKTLPSALTFLCLYLFFC